MGIVFAQIIYHFWYSLERVYCPHERVSHCFTSKVRSLVVPPSFPCYSPDLHPALSCFFSHFSWLFMSLWVSELSLWTPLASTNKTAWELKQSLPKTPLKSKIQQNDSSPSIQLFSELSLCTRPWFPKYHSFLSSSFVSHGSPTREVIQIYASIYTSSCLLQKSSKVSKSLSLLD